MAKSKKSIIKKPAAKKEPVAPNTPETPEGEEIVTQIIDIRGGNVVRVFDLGPLFGIEKQGSTIDLIAKDGVSHFFRRSGTNIAYNSTGFQLTPEDSSAYVTIEEVEAECYEISDADRTRAQEALKEDTHKLDGGKAPDGNPVGTLLPPAPREDAKAPEEHHDGQ